MLFIGAIFLLLHFHECAAGDPCPPKTELAPCTCTTFTYHQNRTLLIPSTSTEITTPLPRRRRDVILTPKPILSIAEEGDALYTVVDCNASKSITELEGVVSSALNRKLVDKLTVSNVPPRKDHDLARLPSGWLKKVRVRQFEVSNSKLSGDFIWNGNPFEGQAETLLWLTAKKCFLSGSLTFDTPGTVNTKGIDKLHQVQGVDFSENYLTSVLSTSFRYPSRNLSTINLSRNSIQSIDGETFHHVHLLKSIDLSHNLLESVSRSFFSHPAKYLETIDLSWNSINRLPEDFFNNMPALRVVNFSNNFLYSISERPWATPWRQLKSIDVTGNFVECNCGLMWLLPILSPPVPNAKTTPAPGPLLGQSVRGFCSKTIPPGTFTVKYELITLTTDRIFC